MNDSLEVFKAEQQINQDAAICLNEFELCNNANKQIAFSNFWNSEM
jgi:hypothetical protein